jgi:hypothetical protein
VPKSEIRKVNKTIIDAFCKGLRQSDWTLDVPGQHYGGLSNQELLDVRVQEGREFEVHTTALDQHVSKELRLRYAQFDARVVTKGELQELAGKLIVLHVANRIMHGGLDISLTPLTPRYAAWKRKQGKGSKPIGVFRGDHLRAIRKARAVWK